MRHEWWESSGTTATCERCGVIRFSETMRGQSTSHRRAEVYKYAANLDGWVKASKVEPECKAVKP